MYKMKLTITGPGLADNERAVKADMRNIEKGLNVIGGQIVNRLKTEIRQNTKRAGSTRALANSIDSTTVSSPTGVLVGIGDTDKMFREAPYWFVVNYGAHFPGSMEQALQGITGPVFIPPPNRGSFVGSPSAPTRGTSERQEWKHRANGRNLMFPQKIRPMNYIEKTNSWLNNYWDIFWANRIR